MNRNVQVAVVGATGLVGREIVAALQSAGHPAEKITALASERSKGQELDYGDETLSVEVVSSESFRGIDLAFFAAPPDPARRLAAVAQSAGAWSVDVSAAHRFEIGTPLVVPAVNLDLLHAPFRGRIVSCASPISAALVTAIEPLRQAFGAEKVNATALMSASSGGSRGIAELERQTADLLSGRDPDAEVFPHRLAFNLIPHVGEFGDEGWTSEESGWAREAARIWPQDRSPIVAGTAIQVPIFFGHLISLEVTLRAEAGLADVGKALAASPHLKLLDSPAEKIYPMPQWVIPNPSVHVGRIRSVARNRFLFLAAIDNVRRGAALSALEIGDALLRRAG